MRRITAAIGRAGDGTPNGTSRRAPICRLDVEENSKRLASAFDSEPATQRWTRMPTRPRVVCPWQKRVVLETENLRECVLTKVRMKEDNTCTIDPSDGRKFGPRPFLPANGPVDPAYLPSSIVV